MLVTQSGSIILQGQIPEKSFPSSRMAYPWALSTRVSRDGGLSWSDIPLKSGENGLHGRRNRSASRWHDSLPRHYIIPGEHPDEGIGQLYTSHDDWRTVSGPMDAISISRELSSTVQATTAVARTQRSGYIGGSSRCRMAACSARFMAG